MSNYWEPRFIKNGDSHLTPSLEERIIGHLLDDIASHAQLEYGGEYEVRYDLDLNRPVLFRKDKEKAE